MKRIILISTLILAACGEQGDQYAFDGSEFERRDQRVIVIEHDNVAALRRDAPDAAQREGRNLYGYSLIYPDRCEIHVADLKQPDNRTWLGHEMTHCVYGRWHG